MKLTIRLFLVLTFGIFIASCNSVPKIPDDATSTQLIQMGQDALEISNYTAAETYYNAVIQRYGMDTATYIEASYELGHLYLKQKRYDEAYQKFDEILATFSNAEIGTIPASYKKLAEMGIERIPEKYKAEK